MPGPTAEVLNEDVKDLKGELREIRDDVHQVDVSVARLQTEFGLAKWLLGLLLVATISGIGSGIRWAASLTADLKNLSSKFDERFKANDVRFDKIESIISKLIDQPRPRLP